MAHALRALRAQPRGAGAGAALSLSLSNTHTHLLFIPLSPSLALSLSRCLALSLSRSLSLSLALSLSLTHSLSLALCRGEGPEDLAALSEGLLRLGVAELLGEGGARDLAEALRAEARLRVWERSRGERWLRSAGAGGEHAAAGRAQADVTSKGEGGGGRERADR